MVYNMMPIQKNLHQAYIFCYFSSNGKKSNLYLILPPVYIHSTTCTIFFSELIPQSRVESYQLILILSLYLTFLSSFLKVTLFIEVSDLSLSTYAVCLITQTHQILYLNTFKNVMEVHTCHLF